MLSQTPLLTSSTLEELTMQPASAHSTSLTVKHWLQISSTFIVFFNTWGLLLTFGVFQEYYVQVLLPYYSSSAISWISTVCVFIVLSFGIITGPLYDHGFRITLHISGTLTQVLGLMLLSLSTKFYQLFLAQAICVGIGAGVVFVPSVAAAASCLSNPATRAKAMGLMACGSSIGGIVYPVMFRSIAAHHGFPWAIRSIAFLMLALYLISYFALLSPFERPPTPRSFFDMSALTDLPFMMIGVGALFGATAYYIPLLYLPQLAETSVPGIRPGLPADLVSILNGASVLGRLGAGLIAARYGAVEMVSFSMLIGSVLLFFWVAVHSLAGAIAWSIFWGMISSVQLALAGAFIPMFCPTLSVIGVRSGMYWMFVGTGALLGSPIGAAIYDPKLDKGVWKLQVFAGMFMLCAAVLTFGALLLLQRKQKTETINGKQAQRRMSS